MPRQMNIASGIREFARASPATVAVKDGDRTLTFAAVDERSSRFATLLRVAGFEAGQRLGVLSRNRLEFVELAAGAAKAGVQLVPLNPRGAASEHADLLARSGARGLVADDALLDHLPESAESLDLLLTMGGTGIGRDYETVLAESRAVDPMVEVDEREPFVVQYTSGTTGAPKGALISHRSRVLTMYGCAVDYGYGPGRRTVAVAPMALGAGFAFGYVGAFMGGQISMLGQWDPEALLRMIETDRIETIFLVPTHAVGLRQVLEGGGHRYDLSSLRTLYFDAAPLPPALKEWVIDAFPGVGVHEVYGSTEAGIVTGLRPPDALRKVGTVGHPWFMTEVVLLDDDGNPVPAGEQGELFGRSPFNMNGYLDDPEATAAALHPDGFLTSGDLATCDDEGFIRIVDRKKDMVISGGQNIYPREIENELYRCPGVLEVAVVGLPDETWGERLAAFVVTDPGVQVEVAELEERLRGRLAGFKTPRSWHLVRELPRNANGKILKRALREQFIRDGGA
jgi:acyl-CoA synthetase (AMP-forming)/AMP-acid ligase II